MKKLLQQTAILLTLLSCTPCSFAQPTSAQTLKQWYQVELLVYSHFTQQALSSEQWPLLQKPVLNWSQDRKLNVLDENIQNNLESVAYNLLPRTKFKLNREEYLLNKQNGYHVVLHEAWYQTLSSPQQAIPIHLYGGSAYDNQGNTVTHNTYGDIQYQPTLNWQIDGTLTLSVKRFIDAHFNFWLTSPLSKINNLLGDNHFNQVQENLMFFRLIQNRRMRSNELNYVDYPFYGILLKIIKLKQAPQLS